MYGSTVLLIGGNTLYLTKRTISALERIIGTNLKKVSNMDLDDELKYVKMKTGKPVIFSKKQDYRISTRGNPLIVRKRICTMADIDKKIERLK